MIVSFWSLFHGQAATTINTIIIASIYAMSNDRKVLLSHGQYTDDMMEKYLLTELMEKNIYDAGYESLNRVLKNKDIKSSVIKNYTIPLLKNNRLDFLSGINKKSKELFNHNVLGIEKLFDKANEYYDLIFLDLHNGINNKYTEMMFQKSDLIVVCISQNTHLLEKIYRFLKNKKILGEKNIVFLIGNYDNNSIYTTKKIKKKYCKNTMCNYIQHNTDLLNACNKGMLLSELIQDYTSKDKFDKSNYINHCEKISKQMVDYCERRREFV